MTTVGAHHRPTLRSAGWSDPAFAGVAEVVHVVAGLVFPPNRQPSAESGMRRAMTSLRIRDPAVLGQAVQRPGEARDAVLAELTVGETYFFRDAGQLEFLRTDVLPTLIGSRGPDQPLRVWSAGCASGEEPYSLAIMLRELGWPHPARILGTDVARPRLEAARRGHYTKWSLRGASAERVERWFVPHASHFLLAPDIRASVEFASLNLVADEYPSAATGTQEQDLVLCRNVLIYFDMESVAMIASRLLASLAPDGWLLLGASDPPLAGLVPCEVMMTPGGVVYRRAEHAARTGATLSLAPVDAPVTAWWISPASVTEVPATETTYAPLMDVDAADGAHVPMAMAATPVDVAQPVDADLASSASWYAAADYARAEEAARAGLTRDPADIGEWVRLVRSLANLGRLREADEECVRALDAHRESPELHYLHATLLAAAGEHRESANASRRALYLDREFIMAHLQLGDALVHLRAPERAARAFESVIDALAQVDDAELVPAADGILASRLRQTAEIRLRGLREAGVA